MAARSRRRWLVLAIGVYAQAASCAFLYGLPSLVPALRADEHLSLAGAGLVVAGPTVGLLATLIAWGAAADRYGERLVMAVGLTLAAVLVAVAALAVPGLTGFVVVLGLAGAAAASVNAASGRIVMGWFARDERGVAMGIRQTAQPLGVGIAALTLPDLAAHAGFRTALLLPAALCLAAALLVLLLAADPPRPAGGAAARTGNPYRSATLWRLHGASALLVLPQFAIAALAMEYLVGQRHWAALTAGAFLAVAQVCGALGRIATGYWSDRVGSRLRPMRQLAVASAAVMLAFALGDAVAPWLAVLAIALGSVITVADNGLAFTATAELAGLSWSGRALGIQNTGQNVVSSLTPPLLGLVVGASTYSIGFLCAAAFPVFAIALTPVAAEYRARRASPAPVG
ncbi:MFS transporter [Actinocatenispora sera]|uniref:MFS transporter n=1 Tax=Actinocatenispora sera TaxID=390989 RepID=A0A810KUA5_9ACTN|nr:MFS transporter [Actinocatenispora sera]BCJ26245.1 MFS transporter [Actinocatenispora sera]